VFIVAANVAVRGKHCSAPRSVEAKEGYWSQVLPATKERDFRLFGL
jgi:hypothetical protein